MSDRNPLPFSLRPATATDALRIGVLGMQVFLDTYATEGIRDSLAREVLDAFSPGHLHRLIERPDISFIVAECNDHLLGFAQILLQSPHPMIDDGAAAELQRLYVQERFTGYGIGWQLLASAEEAARMNGASMLWATVWVGNLRAVAFYPQQGYEYVGAPVYRLQDELHENALFRKWL